MKGGSRLASAGLQQDAQNSAVVWLHVHLVTVVRRLSLLKGPADRVGAIKNRPYAYLAASIFCTSRKVAWACSAAPKNAITYNKPVIALAIAPNRLELSYSSRRNVTGFVEVPNFVWQSCVGVPHKVSIPYRPFLGDPWNYKCVMP